MAALVSCSRESSIKENVSLRNNHSVVFAFNKPFADPAAFADSIANLPNPDSVLVYDTLTVTVNDSIYLMGFLRYNADKVYRYLWHFEQPRTDKDTTKKKCEFYIMDSYKGECSYKDEYSQNGQVHSIAYPSTGVYSPIFVAIDGNNARDTAGIGQYIRVIDTPPMLSVPKDTLWARHKASITFPIFALDSFGVIKKVQVDLDASGKGEAQDWKYEKLGDSLFITIEYDRKNMVDTLDNQKVYISVIDDDNNKATDSVNIHFNQLPVLTLLSPNDDSEESNQDRVLLLYRATDIDNPTNLRYFVHAANPIQQEENNAVVEVIPQLTEKHEVAKNIQETRFEAVTIDGENKIGLTGLIYWDVWVTDGYDTVKAEKIMVADTLRPRRFILSNPTVTEASFIGSAQMQGKTSHKGIIVGAISLANPQNVYKTITDEDGRYKITLPAGSYRLYAEAQPPSTYQSDTLVTLKSVRKGEPQIIKEKLTLKDVTKPKIETTFKSSEVNKKNLDINIIATDDDSGIDSVFAYLNDKPIVWKNVIRSSGSWVASLTNLTDGTYTFKAIAKDSAGNESEALLRTFEVKMTSINLVENGSRTKSMVDISEQLKLTGTIILGPEAGDVVDFTQLTWVVEDEKGSPKEYTSDISSDKKVSLNLDYNAFKTTFGIEPQNNRFYSMYLKTQTGLKSNIIQVGFNKEEAIVFFEKPKDSIHVSIKQNVTVSVMALPNSSPYKNLKISCEDKNGKESTSDVGCTGTPVVSGSTVSISGDIHWAWDSKTDPDTVKTEKIIATLEFSDNTKSISDTITVIVHRDAPSLSISTAAKKDQKVSTAAAPSAVTVNVAVEDHFGTIASLTYGCTTGSNLESVISSNSTSCSGEKSCELSLFLDMPSEPSDNFQCGIRATDDVGESTTEKLSFVVHKYPPIVMLNETSTYTTIYDEMTMKFVAYDTAGTAKDLHFYKKCDNTEANVKTSHTSDSRWTEFTSSSMETTVTMPATAGKYYCAIQVMDADGFEAIDITTFNVLQAPPPQKDVHANAAYPTRSINDENILDPVAKDLTSYEGVALKGQIVKYQWGCADSPSKVTFTKTTSKKEEFVIKLPSIPNEKYTCILKVTDDDGNEVSDTTYINVLLDPPTVKVDRDTAMGHAGYAIKLDAEAHDTYGSIEKYEWSCGAPSQIASNWKQTPSTNTSWTIPATATGNYICVIQVTDDDNNKSRDTMYVRLSTGSPTLTVEKETIYVLPGQAFSLNATKNDKPSSDPSVYIWKDEDVVWFSWQCFDAATKKALETQVKYKYNGTFGGQKGEKITETGNDAYCVVSAQEKYSEIVVTDTSYIRVLKLYPKGVISAADTVGLWSGDPTANAEAIYFYTEEWGGMKSEMGEIGDANMQRYLWTFYYVPKVNSTPINGNEIFKKMGHGDMGTLDTNLAQINYVFTRKTAEDSIKMCLDYRDSSVAEGAAISESFKLRHQAPPVCRMVYFAKAWKNLAAKDTVLETTKIAIDPSITTINKKPVIAYASTATSVKTKYLNGTTWTELGNSAITKENIKEIKISNNGTDLYLAVLTENQKLYVYKSAGGTSAWVAVGNAITAASSISLVCSPKSKNPLVTYMGTNNQGYYSFFDGSKWATAVNITTKALRDIQATFNNNGYLLVVYYGTDYKSYYAYYMTNASNSSRLDKKQTDKTFQGSSLKDRVSVSAAGNVFYIVYHDRDANKVFVRKATAGGSDITFDVSNRAFSEAIANEDRGGQKTSIVATTSDVYLAIDSRIATSQIHVYRLDGSSWKLYGENELPYFGTTFYSKNNYWIRGYHPSLTISTDGTVYVSMLAKETFIAPEEGEEEHGGSGKNFGPIIMKYVADSWKVK